MPILKFIHGNGLQERVGSSGLQLALRRGSRFARAETEWAEDTLALAYAHRGLVLLLNRSAQGLPSPDIAPQPCLSPRVEWTACTVLPTPGVVG